MCDEITAKIAALRHSTGAGVLDARRALAAANGDVDEATKLLRRTRGGHGEGPTGSAGIREPRRPPPGSDQGSTKPSVED
jgi:hypothetical protein